MDQRPAAAALTALLLLSLTACGKTPPEPSAPPAGAVSGEPADGGSASSGEPAASQDPGTAREPAVPKTPDPSETPEPSEETEDPEDAWKQEFEKSLLENYGVTPDHYEDLGNGIYQVYVVIDGKTVPYVAVDSATGDYHG